jgi:hypothetical protein
MNWEDNISKEDRQILLKAIEDRLETLQSVINRSKESNTLTWKKEVVVLENFIETFIDIE